MEKDKNNERGFLVALVIAILLKTSERIGNNTSADNGHFGVTGFQKKHVTVTENTITLNYVGKAGVKHEKTFTDENISRALKRAIKNSPSKFIFTTSDGNRVTADHVNDYLKEFGVSAKDIRGYSANKWILDSLKNITPEETDKKRKSQFAKVLKQVALRVGHGPATLRGHYMMPEVMDTWIEKGELFDMKKAGYVMKGGGSVKSKIEEKKQTVSDLITVGDLPTPFQIDTNQKQLTEDKYTNNNDTIGGNYQFKNEHGSFTSVKVMPVNEDFVRSKDFFTVEVSVRRKDGDNVAIQTKHKTFPISEYDAYISDLKKRIDSKPETA